MNTKINTMWRVLDTNLGCRYKNGEKCGRDDNEVCELKNCPIEYTNYRNKYADRVIKMEKNDLNVLQKMLWRYRGFIESEWEHGPDKNNELSEVDTMMVKVETEKRKIPRK